MPNIPQVQPFRLSDYVGQGINDASGMFRLQQAMQNAPLQRELNQQNVQLGQQRIAQAPLQTDLLKGQVQMLKQSMLIKAAGNLSLSYKARIQSGMDPAQASQLSKNERDQMLPGLVSSGVLTQPQADAQAHQPYDNTKYESFAMQDPAYQKLITMQEKIHHDQMTEQPPFTRELAQFEKMKPSDPGYKEMKARIARETAPTQTQISINTDPKLLESQGSMVASGMPITQVVPGWGASAIPQRQAVQKAAIQQIMAEHPEMNNKQAGEELANRQIDYVAGKRSVTQLTTMLGATRQAVDQLDFNVDKVSSILKTIPSSNLSPVINAIARGEEKWTGDPQYSQLFFYMHAAAMESARILQGGQASIAQLHQGAADEAQKWASINMTPQSFIEGVGPSMKQEGSYRLTTYQKAIDRQRNRNTSGSSNQPSDQTGKTLTYDPASGSFR